MPWPTDAAVERAAGTLREGLDSYADSSAAAALRAAGLPELFGLTDAAECYGVAKQNVDAIAGLPAHVYGPDLDPPYRLRWGRFWLADEIRVHAASRRPLPLGVACSVCDAGPGRACRTGKGVVLTGSFHIARTRAARRANGETA